MSTMHIFFFKCYCFDLNEYLKGKVELFFFSIHNQQNKKCFELFKINKYYVDYLVGRNSTTYIFQSSQR